VVLQQQQTGDGRRGGAQDESRHDPPSRACFHSNLSRSELADARCACNCGKRGMRLVEWAPMSPRPQVVIIGGGFAGLAAARGLAGAAVDVTLVDRKHHHVFQPLLYQVATAGLSPAEIASPIRQILRRQQNTRVLLGDVTVVDPMTRCVRLESSELAYDFLILAAGVTHSYFGNPGWEPHAPGLKTIEDALEIRRRALIAFEQAEREEHAEARRQWLTFVVIGGGPTGVEMAGAFAEIARHSLVHDFRRIDPRGARIVLIEAGPRVLPGYPEELFCDPDTGICNGQHDVFAFCDGIKTGNGLVYVLVGGSNGDGAALRHGFGCIRNQVHQGFGNVDP
jgi:NADPH-dependent 2,4-dienoyl-CoA reductase/sulfur reductase-like enzyme